MKKKLLAMILSAAMAVTAVPGTAVFASDLDQVTSVTADAEFVGDELVEEEAVEDVVEDAAAVDLDDVDESVENVEGSDEEFIEEDAEIFVSDGIFNYTINENGEAVVTGLVSSDAEELAIPEMIADNEIVYDVTAVAENALNSNAAVLTIPSTIKEFGAQKLPLLKAVNVEEGNTVFFAQEGVLYAIADQTSRLVLYPAASAADSFIIPENVGEIAEGAFAEASNLKTVVIGKDVKKIEENAFASFSNPLTVVFNTTVAPEVASKAFYLDKAIDNKFYFTNADVLSAISEKAEDFVESPFFYDPEGGEKLSDTTGIAAFITDGLSEEILALLKAKGIAVEEIEAVGDKELVGASDISTEDAEIANGYYVIETKLAENYYLHIRNDAVNNQGLVEVNNSSQDAIVFKVTSEGNGQYRILSFWSNKRLGVNVAVPTDGENVTQRDIKVYNNQMWYIRKSLSDEDHVVIVNCANPELVMTADTNVNGGTVKVNESTGSDSQLWSFNSIPDPTLDIDEENLYNIVSDANVKMAITPADNNKSTSLKIQALGKDRQRYILKNRGYGNVYTIINFTSEKGLCVTADKRTAGADVVQFGTGQNGAQLWHLIRTTAADGTDAYYIKGFNSNLYVNLAGGKTTAGTNVEINKLTGASTQKWKLVEANIKATVPTGKPVCIISKANKSLYVNVQDGSYKDNTNVNVIGKNQLTSQNWALRHLGDGYYKICNYASKNVLCVKSGNKAEGANIVSRPYKEWNSQIWKLVPAGNDGSFYFINKHTGKYMTIKNGTYKSGTNIEQASLRKDDSQKFYFTNGNIKAGWQLYGSSKRYYNSNLTFKKNCFVESEKYYLNSSGVPYTGFKKCSNNYYYYYKGLNGKESSDTRPYLSKLFGTKKTWNGYTAPKCSYYMTIDNTQPCLATVYTKYPNTNAWNLPVFSFLVSPGTTSTPTDYGNRLTRTKYRWKELMGPSWGQYATELLAYTIIAGSSYIGWTNNGEYFHSVACGYANNHNLNPAVYNLLGTRQSHGCVRMCVRYAWWTYTYVDSNTTVKVGQNLPRPLIHMPQPRAYNSIDPTDPAYTGNYGYTDTRNWVYWNGYLF